MPYVSQAQRRLFNAKAARGEISASTVAHWNKASKGKKLPEYVGMSPRDSRLIAKMRSLGVTWKHGRLPVYPDTMSDAEKKKADRFYDSMSEAAVDKMCRSRADGSK